MGVGAVDLMMGVDLMMAPLTDGFWNRFFVPGSIRIHRSDTGTDRTGGPGFVSVEHYEETA